MKDARLKNVISIDDKEAALDASAIKQAAAQFIADYAKEKDKAIKPAAPPQEQLSFFPTQLCRTSIFFPLPRQGRKALQADPLKLEFQTKWGTIKYYGMRLSVQDEDLLLICLYLAKKNKSKEFLTTFTELQKLLSIIPNQKYNQRFRDAFERLSVASFITYYKKGDLLEGINILNFKMHKRKLLITFDEDFHQEFLRSNTIMSLPFRMRLNGDIAKLLFTFFSSHQTPTSYHTNTLASYLNMNTDQERKYLVKELKKGFTELQSKGFLVNFKYDPKRDIFSLKPIERKKWKKLK